jgi:hypothetical protein
VHVIKGPQKCKIELDETLRPYDIRMSKRDVRRARELVGAHFGKLFDLWEKFNG